MNFLVKHGEKIVTALVVIICGVFISMALNTQDSAEFTKLSEYSDAIIQAQKNNTVKPEWIWSSKNQPALAKMLATHMDRPNESLGAPPPAYTVYPQPVAPWIVKDGNKEKEPEREKVPASLKPLEEFKADPDHGRVFVHFKLPAGIKFFTPVRIEILRGTEAAKVTDLITTLTLNPEEEIPVEAAPKEEKKDPAVKEDDAAAEKKEEPKKAVDPRETARSKKKDPAEPDTEPAGGVAPEAEKGGVPAEFNGVIVYQDGNVEAKKDYFYKARLVARAFKTNEKGYLKDGKREVELVLPKDLTPVDSASGVKLYATGYTDVVKVTTPPNYMLRFAGVVNGELPPVGQLLPPGQKPTYQGNFGVKIWVPAIKNFAKDDVQISIDDPLKGIVKFKTPDGKADSVAYNTGYELVEIKRAMKEPKMTKRKVIKREADGTAVKDENGRVVYEEKEVQGIAVETEVAVVRNTNTKDNALEEIEKSADFDAGKEATAWLTRLAKEQEAERKQKEAADKALREKIKKNQGQKPTTTTPPKK